MQSDRDPYLRTKLKDIIETRYAPNWIVVDMVEKARNFNRFDYIRDADVKTIRAR